MFEKALCTACMEMFRRHNSEPSPENMQRMRNVLCVCQQECSHADLQMLLRDAVSNNLEEGAVLLIRKGVSAESELHLLANTHQPWVMHEALQACNAGARTCSDLLHSCLTATLPAHLENVTITVHVLFYYGARAQRTFTEQETINLALLWMFASDAEERALVEELLQHPHGSPNGMLGARVQDLTGATCVLWQGSAPAKVRQGLLDFQKGVADMPARVISFAGSWQVVPVVR